MDRFLLNLNVSLPPRDDAIALLSRRARRFDPRDLSAAGLPPVAGPAQLDTARSAVAGTSVTPEIAAYIVDVCRATRGLPSLSPGASPRGAPTLLSTACVWAWLTGRDHVIVTR